MKSVFLGLIIVSALSAVLLPIVLQAPTSRAPLARASVIFGGDMMFDRYIRQVASVASGDFIFSCIYPKLRAADLVVANLEGPITAEAPKGGPTFTFPPETAALLSRSGIGMVSLGNNHIGNFGDEGIRSTERYLDTAGVQHFGLPAQAGSPGQRVATTSVNGIPLAFINYNELSGDRGDMIYHITSEIQSARANGFIPIVYAHWGEEYDVLASAYSHELAHSFVDAGAELVVGSHPHVVQENEIYKGKHIYYSLGNFIFDQYFSEAVRHGLLIKVIFSETGVVGIEEIPITLEADGRTCYH